MTEDRIVYITRQQQAGGEQAAIAAELLAIRVAAIEDQIVAAKMSNVDYIGFELIASTAERARERVRKAKGE